MAGQNITLNKATASYPAKAGDAPAAQTVLVQWDPSFATATTLTFALTVTDTLGFTSTQATVTVNVEPKPVAAMTAQTPVTTGGNIQLDGTKSTPAPGVGVTYTWTLVSQT
jgi:hypothetical protein